jgi:hypothetical protein
VGDLVRHVEPLSLTHLTAPGPDNGWSIKDHLAHLTAWEAMLIALLTGTPLHTAFGLERTQYDAIRSTDELNALIERQRKDRSWEDVWARLQRTHDELLATIARLSDAQRLEPIGAFQAEDDPDERPILRKDQRRYLRALRRASALDRDDSRISSERLTPVQSRARTA